MGAIVVPAFGMTADAFEFTLEPIEFFVAQALEVHEARAGTAHAAEQFIEFQLEGLGIAVLSVLNQEHHEERDDRGAGVDHKLPGIGEMEHGTEPGPNDDAKQRQQEGSRPAGRDAKPVSADAERVAQA